MKKKVLAESIILQAMEDLLSPKHHDESLNFFTGTAFVECAELAGMDHREKLGILDMVYSLINGNKKPVAVRRRRSNRPTRPTALAHS